MRHLLTTVALVTALAAGCGDDTGAAIDAAADDAAVDAAIDAPPGPCGAGLQLTGEYIDWDSTPAAFDGVEDAIWRVVAPPGGAMATTAPNGRIILCITRAATSEIDVQQAAYVRATFLADPAVFSPPGSSFTARGLKSAVADAQLAEFGETFDETRAHVLVYKIGAPIPLALGPATTPPQRSFVSGGNADITWTAGATGALTLFPNRPVGGGTATLTSTAMFTGPTTLPLTAGRFTITVIR